MHPEHNPLRTAACTWCGLRALVRLCREQCLRLIAGSHEGGHANATMNQKNILPYDGFAYLVNDTNGEFEWPGITACLAEIIPWRIETARLFGRDMSVPRMTRGSAMLITRTAVSATEPRRFRQLFNACANAPKQFLAHRTTRSFSISIEMAATVSAGIAIMRRALGIVRPSPACRLVRRGASNFDTGERRRQSRLNSVRDFGWSWLARLNAWVHQVPKTTTAVERRINLTFRHMIEEP